jgi:cytochrome P450
MLGLGTAALLQAPEQLARMRDDPQVVDGAIEELLRFLSVVHSGVPRLATRDTVVGGQRIAAGELLVLSLPLADRDPAFAEHPDLLDITRSVAPHLAFGHGVHHCLGAPLARKEMAVAFPALFRRFPTLALDIPFSDIEFRSATVVHGLKALPVTW